MKSELNCLFLKSVARQCSITFRVQQFTHAAELKCFKALRPCYHTHNKSACLTEKCVPRLCHLFQYQSAKATHDALHIHENIDITHMADVYWPRLYNHFWYRFPNETGIKSH